MRNQSNGSCAILGIGKVNLKTGRCKYFNIFETWDGTVEVWRLHHPHGYLDTESKPEFRLVFTAGENPMFANNVRADFHQDQTRRRLPPMTKVDSCRVKDMATLIATYGNKIPGFTYK